MIEFKLKDPHLIERLGIVSWFMLSEGQYWLNLGSMKIYEKSGDAENGFVSYQISRILDDLTDLFENISEPIPDDLFALVSNQSKLRLFISKARVLLSKMLDNNATGEVTVSDCSVVLDWITERTLKAIHLRNSPELVFFRNSEILNMSWYTINDHNSWTSASGDFEMDYLNFVSEIIDFKERLFSEMMKQIKTANSIDWGSVPFSYQRLLEEHRSKLEAFEASVKLLNGSNKDSTNWDRIRQVVKLL